MSFKKKIILSIIVLLLGIIGLAADTNPYASRIKPFGAVPTNCSENSVGYSMTLHGIYICKNTGYVPILVGTINTILPSQSGNSGKYLTTDGSVVSWGTISGGITGTITTNTLPKGLGENSVGDSRAIDVNGGDFSILTPSSRVLLGDPSSINNATQIIVDDNLKDIIEQTTGEWSAGDYYGLGNNSKIELNDSAKLFEVLATNGISLNTNAGNATAAIDATAGISKLGDIGGNGSSTKVVVNDNDSTITNTAATSISNVTPLWGAGLTGAEFKISDVGGGGTERGVITRYNNTAPNNGEIFIGDNGNGIWTASGLSAGTGISVTNGAGSITIGLLNNFFLSGTPTIGGNGTIVTNSKDSAGKVTSTTTGAATITVTFASSFTNGSSCSANNNTTANIVRSSSSSSVLTIQGVTVTGDVISYQCLGY